MFVTEEQFSNNVDYYLELVSKIKEDVYVTKDHEILTVLVDPSQKLKTKQKQIPLFTKSIVSTSEIRYVRCGVSFYIKNIKSDL